MEINNKSKNLFYFPLFKTQKLNIYDSRGNLFYSSDFTNNFKGQFFLPKGKFTTDNNIVRSGGKLKQPSLRLPPKQRNMNHDFSKFEIEFGVNKNKCSIFHDKKLILFDDSFLKKPYYQLAYIIFHEQGHNFYTSEHYADLFSVKKMLNSGFNPSQIIHAIDLTLSNRDKSNDRKLKIFKMFDKYYNKNN